MTDTFIRMYKYRAFAPRVGREAFANAVALKREMWRDLVAMQADLSPRLAEARKAKDAARLAELRSERTSRIADIRRAIAAKGLAWGDYNAVAFQFDGAVRASAARGATPGDKDGALGEAVRRQITRDCRPHHLLSRDDVSIEYLAPSPAELRRSAGSRRSRYRTARMDFQIRTGRNPAGAAGMTLDFVMHRPLPAGCTVVEVRILRTMRPIIRKDGSAGESERWHVTFAVRMPHPERTGSAVGAVGVALDWTEAEGFGTNALVLATDAGTRTIAFGDDHLQAWKRSRELFELAEVETDPATREARLTEARIFRRRLTQERTHAHRTLAAQIARSAGIVGVQKMWLAGKGAKNNTAPSEFIRLLRHAVENNGGFFHEVTAKTKDFPNKKKLAFHVRSEAVAAFSADQSSAFLEAAE